MKNTCLFCLLMAAPLCLPGCDAPSAPATTKTPRTGGPALPPPPPQASAPNAAPPSALANQPASSPQAAAASSAGQLKSNPAPIPSDPSLPVIGPLDIEQFAQEFMTDAEAATKKYERRRIRLVAGGVSGISTNPDGSMGFIAVSPPSSVKYKVYLLPDSPIDVKLQEGIVAEGDFQYVKYDAPHLANCTITKVTQ